MANTSAPYTEAGTRSQALQHAVRNFSPNSSTIDVVSTREFDDINTLPLPDQETDSTPRRSKAENAIIMIVLCSAVFLGALDITIVATALPTIVHELNTGSGYVWIGAVYVLSCAAFVPSWGKLSDIWGRKPLLLAAVGLFWIGSLMAGVSNGAAVMIAARVIQGIGGGGINVLANICIGDLYSEEERGLYFGILSLVWALACALGPVLGGAFSTLATWRWIFYINLPIGGITMVFIIFKLKLHNPHTPVRAGLAAVDWIGSLLFVGGTIMCLIGLESGGVTLPWDSPTVICLLVFGVVAIVSFGVYEALIPQYPLITGRIFKSRSNASTLLVVFFNGILFIGPGYWLPLHFQAVERQTALMSGVWLLAYCLFGALASIVSGVYIKKTRNYMVSILSGSAVAVIGCGLLVDLNAGPPLAKVILYQIVLAIGISPVLQATIIALQSGVEPRDVASATSALAFTRFLASALSVVISGATFSNEMERRVAGLREEIGPEIASRLGGASASSNAEFVASLEGREGDVVRTAFADSMRAMFIVYIVFASLALVASLGIRNKQLKQEHTDYKTGLKNLQPTRRRATTSVASVEATSENLRK